MSPTPGSFAGLGFLAWYLAGKLKAFDRKGHIAKLCLVFLPLLVASLVAVSRVDDYWHHWQDVFAGGIIGLLVFDALLYLAFRNPSQSKVNHGVSFSYFFSGLTVASFCYLQFFPYPFDNDGTFFALLYNIC